MWLHSLFNSSLLALPVALTVGVYIGVEWPRIIRHQVGLGPGSGGQAPSVETNTYCQKEYGISPFPGRYICKSFSSSLALDILSVAVVADRGIPL